MRHYLTVGILLVRSLWSQLSWLRREQPTRYNPVCLDRLIFLSWRRPSPPLLLRTVLQPPDGQVQGTAAFTWSKSIDVKTVRKDVDDDILIHQYVKMFSKVQSVSGRMVKPVWKQCMCHDFLDPPPPVRQGWPKNDLVLFSFSMDRQKLMLKTEASFYRIFCAIDNNQKKNTKIHIENKVARKFVKV